MGVDHPGIGMSDELLSEIRRSARDALQNSSIGRNGIRFYDGGKALFQGGGGVEIQDTGYIIINGSLTGLGEFNWEGTFVQTGQSTFTGPTTFTGTINATGNTAWSGTMSIVGDIVILSGGRLVVGNMIIDPTNGGSVKYPGGAVVKGGVGGGVVVESGAYAAVITNAGASVGKSGRSISVTDTGFQFLGVPDGSPGNGTPQGVYYRDGLGMVRVSTGF